VADPVPLVGEAARIIRPGGSYVVGVTQRPAEDDEAGRIMAEMGVRIDVRRGARRPRQVSADECRPGPGRPDSAVMSTTGNAAGSHHRPMS
jgi:hypothetical protein